MTTIEKYFIMFLAITMLGTIAIMFTILIAFLNKSLLSLEQMLVDKIDELDAYVENLKDYVLGDEPTPLKVQRLHPDAKLPSYAHEGDSGMDVSAIETLTVDPGQTILVKTGIAMAIPHGYEIQVRPRSGLSLKTKLRIVNSPGTVDEPYRGEICVIMENTDRPYTPSIVINKGDRVAQLVLAKVEKAAPEWTDSLDKTDRSDSGFGSSGK